MYLLYVDESGDTGHVNSPTTHFCLSGLVIHELRWDGVLNAISEFRKGLRDDYKLKLREEIHTAKFLNKPGELRRIPKSIRLKILKRALDFQSQIPDISVINIVVDKQKNSGKDVFAIAWETLIQRFHNTLSYKNFPGPQNPDDKGMIITDQTDEPKLRLLTRRMRVFNHVRSKFNQGQTFSVPTVTIIEYPVHRNSAHSLFVQLSDINAYFLNQLFRPSKYIREKGARHYFHRLGDSLCRHATKARADGIVIR